MHAELTKEHSRTEQNAIAHQEASQTCAAYVKLDQQTVQRIKRIALERGVDCQSLVRTWVRGCLEVELRKLAG